MTAKLATAITAPFGMASKATIWRHRKGAIVGKVSCCLCSFTAMSLAGLGQHVWYRHDLNSRTYYEQHVPHPCQQCGAKIPYRATMGHTLRRRTCSTKCHGILIRGKKHPQYKGGGYDIRGYWNVSINDFPEKDHPILKSMANKKNGRLLQHRAIMALQLGRPLIAAETVHHRNGDKKDNRPENLELWVSRHVRGVRGQELICPHCGKSYA